MTSVISWSAARAGLCARHRVGHSRRHTSRHLVEDRVGQGQAVTERSGQDRGCAEYSRQHSSAPPSPETNAHPTTTTGESPYQPTDPSNATKYSAVSSTITTEPPNPINEPQVTAPHRVLERYTPLLGSKRVR